MTTTERRAANTAMECAFMSWSERGGDYVELAQRLNAAAAQAVRVLRTHVPDPDRGPKEHDPCRA